MSRYRATTGELLEQIRQEAKTKDIYNMAFDGDNANTIAKKLKLDVATVKKVLGERFSMSDFKSNEKENKHSENAYELAKRFGTRQEVQRMEQILRFIKQRGYVDKIGYDMGIKITKKYASKLEAYREVEEDWKDTNKRNVERHGSTGKTKDEDRVKSLENEIQRLKLELENEKNATVKPEPNPDTGEVPLTVGVAHKYLKDKQKKEVKKEEVELNEKEEFHLFDNKKDAEKKAKEIGGKVIDGTAYRAGHYAVYKGKSVKEELEEATFSRAMISQLKKAYGNLKTITPDNAKKLNKILDTVTKDGLIDLYKAKIPFVSIGAGGKLSQKHNLSPKDINRIISKEEVQEEVELTEYFATVHSDKKQIADFIKKNKSRIDYVDDDAGGNIEFEGKGAHELADKVKAKFGVRVTKESFEPIEDKSLSLDEDKHTLPSMRVPMTVQYTYIRNPQLFLQTLKGTKTGKKMKHVFPRKMGSGEYILKGTGQDHIDFLKTLNQKGIMPKNKILGEELEEDTNKYITEKIKGLENKAKKTGMPYSILKKVYDRGMAAWKGGHRPGATQQQWAFARVNSFVTKSSGTWGKADKDLAQKVRASESVEESRQLKDKEKEMMVVKNGKVIVIDKSDFDKYKSKGYMAAEDTENEACWDTHKQAGFKMKGGKRVPNCVPKNEELEESVQEADLTDKQVKMVKKVADKLPKDDFKKRYGKDADNVKFGTATNIVKKKLNIDGYEGARNLVDRLLKKERGDE